MAEEDDLWQAIESEILAHRLWTSELMPSPHDPAPARARLAKLGARAIPLLVRLLRDPDRERRRQAALVLEEMGAVAKSAAQALAAYATAGLPELETSTAAHATAAVDLTTACAHRLDRRLETRGAVADWVYRNLDAGAARDFFARILRDDADPSAQCFVLGGDRLFGLGFRGLHEHPALAERSEVERLASSDDDDVRRAAPRASPRARSRP